MTTLYWFHFDIINAIGHVMAVTDPLPMEAGDANLVRGYRYEDVGYFPQDFIGDVLQMASSDGDGMLMAAEMQGNDHLWQRLGEAEFNEIAARGALMGSTRTEFTGYRVADGRAFATTGADFEPEITESLAVG